MARRICPANCFGALSLSLISFNGLGYGSSKISKVCSLGLSLSDATGYLTYIKCEKFLFFPAQGAVPRCLSIPVEEASEFLQQDLKNKINCTVAKVSLHQLLDLLPDRQTLTFVNLSYYYIYCCHHNTISSYIILYYHYSLSLFIISICYHDDSFGSWSIFHLQIEQRLLQVHQTSSFIQEKNCLPRRTS